MTPSRENRSGRSGCNVLFALAIAILALYVLRGPLLTALGSYLVINETPAPSDVIVVLGGGNGEREIKAVSLFQQGMGRRIILTGGARYLPGLQTTWADLMMKQIADRVPDSLIIAERRSTSTLEDATYVLEDLRALGAGSALVVTDPYHLRRARATFRHVFGDSGIRLSFVAPDAPWFRADTWWQEEAATTALMNEYTKIAFYAWHHHIWPWS